MKRTLILAAVATAVAGQVQARDYISIVGSSTVYPFATVVAEQFGKTTDFRTPKIESTGSGGGISGSAISVQVGSTSWAESTGRFTACSVALRRSRQDLLCTAYPHFSCLLYTSSSPRDGLLSRMPSSA